MTDKRVNGCTRVYLDNMPFAYDVQQGVFISSTALSNERLSLEDVRRRGMILSLLEVVTVDGVPFIYLEERDRLYRLGNRKVEMTGDEFYERERGSSIKVAYPYGEAFRAVVEKELDNSVRCREEEKGRNKRDEFAGDRERG